MNTALIVQQKPQDKTMEEAGNHFSQTISNTS